jgi:L-cysteate sulfo-lyase
MPRTRVVGIDIDAEPQRVRQDVVTFARAAAALLELPFAEAAVEMIAGHAGPAYGAVDSATVHAVTLAGRLEAMVLDPVYSAKGLAGLMQLLGAAGVLISTSCSCTPAAHLHFSHIARR